MKTQSQQKIMSRSQLREQVKAWQNAGEKVVFTNGCFDLLHIGHVDYLEKAASLGDRLVVALNTDRSVQKLKGLQRPIVPEQPRLRVMAALGFVDAACLFDEETPLELIIQLMPNVLVKGGDYTLSTIVGAKEVMANGGEVRTIELVAGFSTSNIVAKIKKGGA